jgi:quercetin dioxygenase-like cupin family protein
MIRCVRLWTGPDGHSLFEEGTIAMPGDAHGDLVSLTERAANISFHETPPGGEFTHHQAPSRQFVLTISGTLTFKTGAGATFDIRAGDVLLAEDTIGTGHSWKLIDNQPWRRAYVVIDVDANTTALFAKVNVA